MFAPNDWRFVDEGTQPNATFEFFLADNVADEKISRCKGSADRDN